MERRHRRTHAFLLNRSLNLVKGGNAVLISADREQGSAHGQGSRFALRDHGVVECRHEESSYDHPGVLPVRLRTEPATQAPGAKSPVTGPQVAQEPKVEAQRFSFDEIAAPSLIEINNGQFRKDLGDKRYALTNVGNSFERLFTIIFDEQRGMHIIQDKQGRVLFEGRVDGVPRYAASLDIDGNGSPDVLLHAAAYGNHGNGRELFELYLNENGRLIPQENPVAIEFNAGQEDRAGKLTWFSDPPAVACR